MKILVVEPYIEQQEWLMETLNRAGHEVVVSCDADWSFIYWQAHRPFDLIIMGSILGGRKLWKCGSLIEAIRAVDPDQPFLVQAKPRTDDALPPGVAFLCRPFGIRRLMKALASVDRQRLPLFAH